MATDEKLQALLELERRGKLTPQLSQMLSGYRAQGVTKTKPLGPQGQPVAARQDTMETAANRDKARAAMDLINRVQPQLDRVRSLYNSNLKGAGLFKSVREILPSQRNAQFDRAADQLATLVRPANHTPGEGAMSDFESRLALRSVPDRWSFDGSNEEALSGLQTFLDTSRADYGKRMGLPTPPPRPKKARTNDGWSIEEVR